MFSLSVNYGDVIYPKPENMKFNKLIFSAIFISALTFGQTQTHAQTHAQTQATENNESLSQMESQLKNPSKDFRSAPLYTWNGKITKQELDKQLTEMKDAGFGGVFIHPRPGMLTEYLSDEWFDMYAHTIKKSKELGMNVWIYDENSYPSGFAGGHVPAEMPESYNQGSGLVMTTVEQLPDTAQRVFLCLKEERGKVTDITGKTAGEMGKRGRYYIFNKTYYQPSEWMAGGYPYVDLIHPGVTEKFLEITMSGYIKNFGNEFGKIIKGSFTDEPEIGTPGGIRWTVDFFEQFQKRFGYDPIPKLPMMFAETGEWKKFRHDYNKLLTELFIDRWAKVSYDYYSKLDLEWTGHYWEHGWPDMNLGGDNMAMYAWHHMPAIDMLFNQFDDVHPWAQFGNIRAVKELASAARQTGRKRTLSETYGGASWEATFNDFKRLGDWEYVLGVNFMNQHFSNYTLRGKRKNDYPPFFSYQASWFKNYKVMNDYHARLSQLLSSGNQPNDIIILEPNSTIWMYYSHARHERTRISEIGLNFQKFVTRLEKEQVEYDLGSELIIADRGSVKDGRFIVGEVSYSTVVIPPDFENLDQATAHLLKDFVAQGGKLVAFSIPQTIEGEKDNDLNSIFKNVSNISYYSALTDEVIAGEFRNADISFDGKHNNNLYHHRRVLSDGELIFVTNASLESATEGTITANGRDVQLIDLFSGELYSYPVQEVASGKMKISYKLEPAGSIMFFVSKEKKSGYPVYQTYNYTNKMVPSSEAVVKRLSDNVLAIDFLDLSIRDTLYKDTYTWKAANAAFRNAGFTGNPWGNTQYKTIFNDRDTMTVGGFEASYKFTIEGSFPMGSITAVAEHPELFAVSINGQRVKPESGKWWLDRSFPVYKIGKHLKQGENVLTISIPKMSVYAEIEPVYIVGDFSVEPASKGFKITAPHSLSYGSWKKQGLPFYSWDVSYSQKFDVADIGKHYAVSLGDWKGTVSEVFVNGKSAGVVAFAPYTIDVTKLLRKGSNTIEVRVTGSHQNLMGPFHVTNPGMAGPGNFSGDPKYPAGSDYYQVDYGVMKGITLMATE